MAVTPWWRVAVQGGVSVHGPRDGPRQARPAPTGKSLARQREASMMPG